IFDGSAGGLGGCPFAPGATGNAATEDLGVLLHGLGYDTGLDLGAVAAAAARIGEGLDHPLTGRAHNALLSRAKSTNEGDTC
ncbi:MAG: hydroxymethylglutaryl-CoA lyase, partial [Myxococcota bacterium]|nr:hydroxymethylglutaryl-CoA lyase [Myxococcota bacterium]